MTKIHADHHCTEPDANDDFDRLYGPAITEINYDAGDTCWGAAADREYRTAITFCPWCGMKLPVPPVEGPTIELLTDEELLARVFPEED